METFAETGSKPEQQEALNDSRGWLRSTLSSIGDAVITTDAQGRITFLNSGAQALTGWTQEEAVGVSLERVFRIVNKASRETVENPALRALREGVVDGLVNHTVLMAKDGSERHIDGSVAPIPDADGNAAGVMLVFRYVEERRRLEQVTAEALAHVHSILATLQQAYLVLDADLRVQSANAAFYTQFLTTEAETVGRTVYELGNGQWNIQDLRTKLENSLRSKNAFEDLEVEHDFLEIGRRVLKVNARRIQDGEPEGRGLILMGMEDVTERKRLEAALHGSEVRYRRLFQSAKDGILILDAGTGKIIDANAFMCGLLGAEVHELLGKELHEIGLFEDIAANKAAFQELQQNGYIRYEHLPVKKSNGEVTHVEFVSNTYQEDHRFVAQCNVRDISARVEMERQVRLQTEALADQHRRKDEFLAMLSHELRNPLAPIRSATHLLRLQARGGENPIARQAREVIERQVAQLTKLVSDLLEVSRVVSGRIRLDLETVDLTQVVLHSLESTGPVVARQKHEVSLTLPQEPLWVRADSARLEQVVVNLLTNAAKFTDEGGRIGVSMERDQDHAELRVRDSGIGIAADMMPHLFDLFSQADRSLHRSQGGLGIGLSLVQRLVSLHGGTVEARSEGLLKGSEFVVRLPLAPAPGEQPRQIIRTTRESDTSDSKRLRVLVVDDNADACESLAILVRMQGYGVQIAFTGREAIHTAKTWKPDVVLLDIGLPELDGYEVARRLRIDPELEGVKLVAITGYGNEKDLQLSREAGFDTHFLKPVELPELERLLDQWDRVSKA